MGSSSKVTLYCSPVVASLLENGLLKSSLGHTIVLINHHTELDWLFCWKVGSEAGVLGNSRAFAKRVLSFLPVIGWSSFLSEDIFLARDWAKDRNNVAKAIERLGSYLSPVWLHIFPEGTRRTQEKLKESQKFAESRCLPVLQHHLTPRTKGFTFTVEESNSIETIIDLTVVKDKDSRSLSFKNILNGKSTRTSIFFRKFNISEIPATEEGASQWIHQLFKEKDDIISKYQGGEILSDDFIPYHLKPPKWTLVLAVVFNLTVLAFLCFLLMYGSTTTLATAAAFVIVGLYAMGRL